MLFNSSMKRLLSETSELISFDDMLIRPTYTSLESRSIPDTTSDVAGFKLSLPIISSPMNTITEHRMAIEMSLLGAMGIVHRFMSIEDQLRELDIIKKYEDSEGVKIKKVFAVGVGDSELLRAKSLIDSGVDAVAIDVANGHSSYMKKAISLIKEYNSDIKIIAGNVSTDDGYMFLAGNGADAVRVGIGGGSICKTRIQTGCGIPTLYSVAETAISRDYMSNNYPGSKSVSIIADGGIRYPADLVKSIASGADAIMCGRILAATDETPGDIVLDYESGIRKKIYAGMASEEVQIKARGGLKPLTCAEGVSTMIECNGSVKGILSEFLGGLKSGMTYVNARNISELRENSVFKKISSASLVESHAFGTKK
jgi:IMP dehydrogenase